MTMERPLPTSSSKRRRVNDTVKGRNKTDDDNDPRLKFKSPAEFFAENKNIAGFDNPGKSLYTTIRELVENALDAAEAVPVLPEIQVTVEELSEERFNEMVGMGRMPDRVDVSLYKDVEKDQGRGKARGKRKIPEEEWVPQEKSDGKGPPVGSGSQGKDQTGIFRIVVRDNGTGMAHQDVPNMMGRVLAGTKYCVRQARGKFGLGSKMALIWSKMSTGLPVEVRTSRRQSETITLCLLDIDIAKNNPNALLHRRLENPDQWRGSEVSVTIVGNWTSYRAKVIQYMRMMAVITPYAHFSLKFLANDQDAGCDAKDEKGNSNKGRSLVLDYARRSEKMPDPPKEVKHHPSSVDQLLMKQLISEVDPSTKLIDFFIMQFTSIDKSLATRLVNELGDEFSASMPVKELDLNRIRRIHRLFKAARFDAPDGSCLSPAGEYNLRLGIMKELRPDMVSTYAETAAVFEGHPFVVEAGVSLGGPAVKPGINVFRFANRIPLLFEGGNDVVTRTALKSINWAQYKMSSSQDRIGVFCSIVSTKIPFKGTGKEYIADDAVEIKTAVKKAISQCCSQLKVKLIRRAALKGKAERKKQLVRYIPDVVNALIGFFDGVKEPSHSRDIISKLKSGTLTKEVFRSKLMTHVDQVDKEQALDFAVASGREKSQKLDSLSISRRGEAGIYGPVIVVGSQTNILSSIKVQFIASMESAKV